MALELFTFEGGCGVFFVGVAGEDGIFQGYSYRIDRYLYLLQRLTKLQVSCKFRGSCLRAYLILPLHLPALSDYLIERTCASSVTLIGSFSAQ